MAEEKAGLSSTGGQGLRQDILKYLYLWPPKMGVEKGRDIWWSWEREAQNIAHVQHFFWEHRNEIGHFLTTQFI